MRTRVLQPGAPADPGTPELAHQACASASMHAPRVRATHRRPRSTAAWAPGSAVSQPARHTVQS